VTNVKDTAEKYVLELLAAGHTAHPPVAIRVAEAAAAYADAAKRVIMIAGPNGAGKTTFAGEFLVHEAVCPRFINADYISAGLSPFAPETAAVRAGRIMLAEIRECVRKKESFAVETTLAGRRYIQQVAKWQRVGYGVKLIFLCLQSVDIAIRRVAARAAQGGHNVAEETIRRRYAAGWRNFNAVYKTLVDAWAVYDNSGPQPLLMDEGENE